MHLCVSHKQDAEDTKIIQNRGANGAVVGIVVAFLSLGINCSL